MKWLGATLLVFTVMAAPALGARVFLKDGRVLEGVVTESPDKILIETPYGVVGISPSEVSRIDRTPSPLEIFRIRQTQTDQTDPDALAELAQWARERGLGRQADDCLQAALDLDGDHPEARRLSGYLRADGKWLEAPEALQLAEARLQAGKVDSVLKDLLPALAKVVQGRAQQLQLKKIQAHARLQARQFSAAQKAFETLAGAAPRGQASRYRAIADILKSHPDGMYVLNEPYPALASVLSEPPAVKRGPASLARPEVLAAAIRDRAKAAITTGRELMSAAQKLERTEPEAAKAKYVKAAKAFDDADALVTSIARSYRIEIARRRVAMITRDMNVWAGRFDTLKAELAKRDLTPAAYGKLITRMMRALDNVRSDLDVVLELTQPFEKELVLEVTDATMRRQRIEALRGVLAEEMRQLNGDR